MGLQSKLKYTILHEKANDYSDLALSETLTKDIETDAFTGHTAFFEMDKGNRPGDSEASAY